MSFNRMGLVQAVATRGSVARIVVVETKGSAPREAGAAMLVWDTGQSGTIGGGALELAAVQAARMMIAAGEELRLTHHALGPELGQCCGGSMRLLTEVYDAARVEAIPNFGLYARPVATTDAMPLAVKRLLNEARGKGMLTPARLVQGWMVEPVSPPARPLWVWGAGHVGRAVVSVLAPLPDFTITWIDTASDRFPDTLPQGVRPRIAADPVTLVIDAPNEAEHLILTYSHALDLALCHALLLHGFASAGLIGSATKWARFRNRLQALGHSDAQILRIACPIGNPALGKHPQAIAVGVASALLMEKGKNVMAGEVAR